MPEVIFPKCPITESGCRCAGTQDRGTHSTGHIGMSQLVTNWQTAREVSRCSSPTIGAQTNPPFFLFPLYSATIITDLKGRDSYIECEAGMHPEVQGLSHPTSHPSCISAIHTISPNPVWVQATAAPTPLFSVCAPQINPREHFPVRRDSL